MEFTLEERIAERDRRMALIDRLMQEDGLDAVFFTSTAQQTCQLMLRYFTSYQLTTRRAYIWKKPGEQPYLCVQTVGQAFHARRLSWLPEDHILCGDAMKAYGEFVASLGKEPARIGVYESREFPVWLDTAIRSLDAEYEDITYDLTVARQPKSEYEVRATKAASEIARQSFEHIVPMLHGGVTSCEIVGEAEGFVRKHAGEETLILTRSARPHTYIARPTDEPIADDCVFVYSVEMAGKYGYWTQMIRPVFLKPEAQPEALRILAVIKKAEAAGVAVMKVGNRVCDVAAAIEKVIIEEGFATGLWAGHGMGADLGDGVDIGTSNEMEIVPNMVLTLHPSVRSDKDGLFYGNTWLATEDGAVCLTPGYEDVCDLSELKKLVPQV